MNAAQCLVRAILESDEDLMAELGEIASNPLAAIKLAMERGEEIEKRFPPSAEHTADLTVHSKPHGKISNWVTIMWTHDSGWGSKRGGGSFLIKTEQLKGFLEELAELVRQCAKPITSDEWIRRAYSNVLRWRHVASYQNMSPRAATMARNRSHKVAYLYFDR